MTTATTTSRRVHFESRTTEALNTAPVPDIPSLRHVGMPTVPALIITTVAVLSVAANVTMVALYLIAGAP